MAQALSFDLHNARKVIGALPARQKLALVYHIKISDTDVYEHWCSQARSEPDVQRSYRVCVDPVPREGILLNEIVIDEFSTGAQALKFLESTLDSLDAACTYYSILCVVPESAFRMFVVRLIAWWVQLLRGVPDYAPFKSSWSAPNTDVWPDTRQMIVAQAQLWDEPLWVYNLNQYREKPGPLDTTSGVRKVFKTGKEAYQHYAKMAGIELLKRGAFPVFGGQPICLIEKEEYRTSLADRWDQFVLVRYRRRSDLFELLETPEFVQSQPFRSAGLKRAIVFMAKKYMSTS